MRLAALAFALAAAVVLTGCVPQGPAPAASPDPTFEPVFASDEEALAAAEAAYGEYLNMVDRVASEAGADPRRLGAVVTGDRLNVELEGMKATFSDPGHRLVGNSDYRDAALQSWGPITAAEVDLVIYVCLDISGTKTIDAQGNDVTPSRDNRLRMEVAFVASREQVLLDDARRLDMSDEC